MKKACKKGQKDLIELILLHNDNSIMSNYEFINGFKYACQGGHLEIIKMMLSLGATDYNWGLQGACKGGHIEIVKMLIELGANDYYYYLKNGNLALQILYIRLTGKVIDLPIKTEHPEYHLLRVYNKKVPDINRLINKYLF